jgi:hypothetical protein
MNTNYRTAIILEFVVFVTYNVNLRSITSFDTYPTRLLPISIIRHFTLNLDSFEAIESVPQWYVQRGSAVPNRGSQSASHQPNYWLVRVRGHYMSMYPVMPAILATPVYVLPVLLGMTNGPGSEFFGIPRASALGGLLVSPTGILVYSANTPIRLCRPNHCTY